MIEYHSLSCIHSPDLASPNLSQRSKSRLEQVRTWTIQGHQIKDYSRGPPSYRFMFKGNYGAPKEGGLNIGRHEGLNL